MSEIDLDEVRKRHAAASDEVVRLCSPGERWRMSIPADEKRDSDLVLDVALADIPALLRIIEGYDRTPAEKRAARAEDAVERVRALTDESRRTGRRLSALDVVDALDGAS